jgi:formylglycine-generating enzyme required for sulfatase activity
MLLQVADGTPTSTRPPSGFAVPQWDLLSKQEMVAHEVFISDKACTTVTLGPASVTLGHQDIDKDDHLPLTKEHSFGWDNESPPRSVEVPQFKIEWRPVSNGQYYEFLKGAKNEEIRLKFPSSWVQIGDDVFVRTLYGPVLIEIAYHWPVITSYDDISAYARVQGGRIPTEPELRLFLDTFCSGYLGGGNVGFRNWHPIALVVICLTILFPNWCIVCRPTAGGAETKGCGHNGGVWEWTSTTFDQHEGFSSSELYPG